MIPRHPSIPPRLRAAFTFVEVLIILMVISIGLLGVLALVAFGTSLVTKVNAGITGLATAISVAADPQPLLDPAVSSEWIYSPYSLSAPGEVTCTARGFINGFYVERVEITEPSDIISKGANGVVYARSAHVEVKVYDTFQGKVVTTFITRIVRQKGTP